MKTNRMDQAIQVFTQWYNQLPIGKGKEGPAMGTISAALVVLERLQKDFVLDLDLHRTKRGKSQIAGLNPAAVIVILKRYGETRYFLKEAGRTNRGVAGDIAPMLDAIEQMQLDKLPSKERDAILKGFQKFLTERVQDYHNRQKLKVLYDQSLSSWQFISNLLKVAGESGKEGPVAQYLIGAKLELRYPHMKIGNFSASTADEQSGRRGDFQVKDTVFHVTVSPMPSLAEKCKANINDGFRVYLLVPDGALHKANALAEMYDLKGKVFVESIESFVGQNIEELSVFSRSMIVSELRQLLEIYNRRVDVADTDKSLLIIVPPNLTER
jgi:hypothetical protein